MNQPECPASAPIRNPDGTCRAAQTCEEIGTNEAACSASSDDIPPVIYTDSATCTMTELYCEFTSGSCRSPSAPSGGVCQTTTELMESCVEGVSTYRVTSLSPCECPVEEVQVPCRRAVIELPFFNTKQIIIVVLIITILYLIMFKVKIFKRSRKK